MNSQLAGERRAFLLRYLGFVTLISDEHTRAPRLTRHEKVDRDAME
jgi:hypothetical protein